MFNITRRPGQWIEITHRSGDTLRIKADRSKKPRHPNDLDFTLDDDARHFEFKRPECGRNRPADAPDD